MDHRFGRGTASPDSRPFVGDTLVEGMCNYGESLLRVFGSIAVVYVGIHRDLRRGGRSRPRHALPGGGQSVHVTHRLMDLAVFSLGAMTTSGAESTVLVTSSLYVKLLTGLQALTGIFLTGLLGFVAGHRIRR